MNKQNNFIKIAFAFLGIFFINMSCKKYIDQGPITATYGSKFWTSQTSVEQATLAMYGQLRSSLRKDGSYFINGDLTSGNFIPKAGQWNYQAITPAQKFNFRGTNYLNSLLDWSRFYQVIGQTNLVLQNVPKMPASLFTNETKKNAYLGEALFIRAYTYFYITRIWGDPVYITKVFDDVDYGNIQPVARTAEAIVMDSCISDLKKAANYLDYSGGDPVKSVRANKGSIYALMAHIYAWKHDYVHAHIACQNVINNGGYTLEPIESYSNIWKGKSSAENIFELSMNFNPEDPNFNNQNDWAEAQFSFFGTFVKGPIVDNQNNQCWLSPDGGFMGYMDTTADKRYKAIWQHIPATGDDAAGYMMHKYTRFNYQKPDSKTLAYLDNTLVLLRLSDINLLDAESLASANDLPGARAALSKTELRAGIEDYLSPTNAYDMLDEIVIERGRELIGEGHWYYDLIRTDNAQGWLVAQGYPANGRINSTNKGYYWPLDMGLLFPQNTLLTQNPWWSTHL